MDQFEEAIIVYTEILQRLKFQLSRMPKIIHACAIIGVLNIAKSLAVMQI